MTMWMAESMQLLRWFFPRRRSSLARGLFAYFDGRRRRVADPLEIDAKLRKHGGDQWGEAIALLHAGETGLATGNLARIATQAREEAIAKLSELARHAFELVPLGLDGSGLSIPESLNVLAAYLSFLATLKERWGPFPISSARLASDSPAESATEQSSASGPTSDASASAATTQPPPH